MRENIYQKDIDILNSLDSSTSAMGDRVNEVIASPKDSFDLKIDSPQAYDAGMLSYDPITKTGL